MSDGDVLKLWSGRYVEAKTKREFAAEKLRLVAAELMPVVQAIQAGEFWKSEQALSDRFVEEYGLQSIRHLLAEYKVAAEDARFAKAKLSDLGTAVE